GVNVKFDFDRTLEAGAAATTIIIATTCRLTVPARESIKIDRRVLCNFIGITHDTTSLLARIWSAGAGRRPFPRLRETRICCDDGAQQLEHAQRFTGERVVDWR